MVDYSNAQLDLAFAALADPTRRAIVDRLARENELAVTEIAGPFKVDRLKMEEMALAKETDAASAERLANLRAELADSQEKLDALNLRWEREKTGRTVHCRLRAAPMESAMQWLTRYERFWTERLDALAKFVEEESCPNPKAQASPSSAGSKPPRKRSSPPGRTRKK